MKRLFWFLAALALLLYLGALPFYASDVASLLPVETVFISRSGDGIRVDVGAGIYALGQTVAKALDALQKQVTGRVFFQTAEQVIVADDASAAIDQVLTEPRFRPAAGLYRTQAPYLQPQAVSDYLKTRVSPLTIGQAQAAAAQHRALVLPVLEPVDGGFRVR